MRVFPPAPEPLESRIAPAFGAVFDVSRLTGANGFEIDGAAERDYTGRSVSSAGDVNGDGFDDILIGAENADANGIYNSGASYVVFGAASGFPAALSLAALDGSNGFRIEGTAQFDRSGSAVSKAGDVNDDGFADVVIAGTTGFYVLFGKQSGFAPSVSLTTLDGQNGFKISGVEMFNNFQSVGAAGDVNGDGFDDVIVGGIYPSNFAGAAYVVFGKADGFAPDLNVSDLTGSNGFRLDGSASGDDAGISVSGAGDMNGDGFDDVIVGAHRAASFSGAAYIVFGKAGGFAASLSLSALNGENGFSLVGVAQGDQAGAAVGIAGDINADGFDDVIIGAPGSDANGDYSGAAYVVFGKARPFAANLSLAALDGANGFRISGANGTRLGSSVSGDGDVNGDGFDDVVAGSYSFGGTHVIYGKAGGFSPELKSAELDGTNGFRIQHPASRADASVAGDINRDGLADIVVSDYLANTNSGGFASGASWVVLGQVQEGIDLRVSITDSAISTMPANSLNYVLDYANTGTIAAAGTVITEVLPTGTSFLPEENPGWAQAGDMLTYQVGSLAPGAGGTAMLLLHTLSPAPAGVAQIISTVAISDNGANGLDRAPSNNIATDANILDAAPELSVALDDGVTATTPGEAGVYTVNYRNDGNQDARGVVLTETLPIGATFDAAASTPGWTETAIGSGVFKLDIGSLAGGGASGVALFAITLGKPAAAGLDEIVSTVGIADDGANGSDPSPANNVATDSDALDAAPDLTIEVTNAINSTAPGSTLAYTLRYRNDGNQDATGVFLSETLPAGAIFSVAGSTDGWTETAPGSHVYTLPVGPLAGGGTGMANFVVILEDVAAAGVEQISSRGSIGDDGANGLDPRPETNTSTDADLLGAAPDLILSVSDGLSAAAPGATLIYTLGYRNEGNQDATGVVLTETLPDGATFSAGTSTPGWVETTPASGVFTLSIGALAGGGGAGAAIFVVNLGSPAAAGHEAISSCATVGDDATNGPDPSPGSNTATDSDILRAAPDLAVTVDNGASEATPGALVTYTLSYRNDGNQNATGVFVTQSLPVGATFDAAASSPGWTETTPGSGLFKLNLGEVAGDGGGGSALFSITIDNPVAAGRDELATLVAIRDDEGNGPDATPANNTAADTDLLNAAPDLVLSVSDGVSVVVPGATVTYALAYRNDGDQNATGVFLTQSLPSGASFVGASSSPGWTETISGSGLYALNIGLLAGGSAEGSALFAVRLDDGAAAELDQIISTATISDDGTNGPDRALENNTVSDADELEAAPDLAIVSGQAIIAGADGWMLSSTLSYRNLGNQEATGVVLTEMLSANAVFDAASSTSGWIETSPGSGVFTLAVSALPSAASGNASFASTVAYPAGGGIEEFVERSMVADDGANGSDPAPENDTETRVISLIAPMINAKQRRATFTDSDGDRVTVSVNRGSFSPADFTLFALDGGPLHSSINLSDDGPEFARASLEVKARRSAPGTGDGLAHIGSIDATGIDLVAVSVRGNLGQIDTGDGDSRKPALARLSVGSLGSDSPSSQSAEMPDALHSDFAGSLSTMKVKGDLRNAVVDVAGNLKTAIIRGDLDGSAGGAEAGVLRAAGDIHKVLIKGSLLGGAERSGIFAGGALGRVTIGGDVRGADPAQPVQIVALGDLEATSQAQATAIADITVKGSVAFALILAGYDPALTPVNADASIGNLKVLGSWNASSIAAGVADATNDGFGRNDAVISNDTAAATILARIANITIKGGATGSPAPGDHFGIVAEQIGKLIVGGSKYSFSSGPNSVSLDAENDDFRAVDFG